MGTKRSTHWYRKNEEQVMKQLGFRPTKNSGSGWVEKEDGQSEHCICQLKSTDAMSISVKQTDLRVLEYNASVAHKTPVFAVQFINTGEVWLMVKPEDIGAIQDIVQGKEPEKKQEESEESVDFWNDMIYNEEVSNDNNNVHSKTKSCNKNLKARLQYEKTKREEAEQRQRRYKEEMKERRASWRGRS